MNRLFATMVGIAIAGALAAGASSVLAHHSTTMFDHAKTVTIKGVVVELRWVNPHVSLTVHGTLKSGEAPAQWLIETTSPGHLTRVGGWQRDTVKPGEGVEVVFHPLRDGSKRLGLLRTLTTLSNGQVYAASIRDVETADLQ